MESIKQWLVNLAEPFYLKVFMPWFESKGFILYGGGGKGGDAPDVDPRIAQYSAEARFRPFSLTTSAGRGFGGPDGQFGATASQPFQNIQQLGLAGAQQTLPALQQQTMRGVTPFDFNTNVDQLTQDYFTQQSQLLQPAFAQQRNQLQNDLFGSGRMGLSLAGGSIGAGEGSGMFQPDAFGLGRAQSQTLGELGAQSRQMALSDAQSRLGLEQGVLGTQEQLQQQRFENLLRGGTGMFGYGTSVADLEQSLLRNALAGETARGMASSNAATGLANAYQLQAQQAESEGGKGLLGSIAGSAAGSFLGPLGGSLGKSAGGFISGKLGGLFGGGGAASSNFSGANRQRLF